MLTKHKNILFGLNGVFKNHGWHIKQNDHDCLSYTKMGQETDIFEIKTDKREQLIYVSVPVKNSPYQYRTTFHNLQHASDFVESRFYDFCD
jgi:hypothetical protein